MVEPTNLEMSMTNEDRPLVNAPSDGANFSFFGNGEFKPPPGRVVGVYYDKQRRIWRANWREGEVGKRKTKNFSVDDYGFEEARRLAIEYRLMKITEIAQMELNCTEIDRLRLSTCRAPAQSTGERRPKREGGPAEDCFKRSRSISEAAEPYAYSGVCPPPSGDYYDPNGMSPQLFWNMNYGQQQPGEYFGADTSQMGPPMWYYNPEILYNLYQQHAEAIPPPIVDGMEQPTSVEQGESVPVKEDPAEMHFGTEIKKEETTEPVESPPENPPVDD